MALRTIPIRQSGNRPNLFMGGDREGTQADISDWTRATGQKLVGTLEVGAGVQEFYIGKP